MARRTLRDHIMNALVARKDPGGRVPLLRHRTLRLRQQRIMSVPRLRMYRHLFEHLQVQFDKRPYALGLDSVHVEGHCQFAVSTISAHADTEWKVCLRN